MIVVFRVGPVSYYCFCFFDYFCLSVCYLLLVLFLMVLFFVLVFDCCQALWWYFIDLRRLQNVYVPCTAAELQSPVEYLFFIRCWHQRKMAVVLVHLHKVKNQLSWLEEYVFCTYLFLPICWTLRLRTDVSLGNVVVSLKKKIVR